MVRRIATFLVVVLAALFGAAAVASAQTVSSALWGGDAGGRFGQALRDAGDCNDDGMPDLIVGMPLDDRDGVEKGRALIWFGGTDQYLTLKGTGSRERFGFSVAGIGDVNGDGVDDVIVGAPYYSGGTETGRAYVFFGGSPIDAVPDLTLTGEVGGDRFGWSVSRGGDLDDDGRPDFLVGAPLANTPGLDAGAVYLCLLYTSPSPRDRTRSRMPSSA